MSSYAMTVGITPPVVEADDVPAWPSPKIVLFRLDVAPDHVFASACRQRFGLFLGMATRLRRHWVIVLSREHARRGVTGGFVMANHGKRAPLARMSLGDGILVYSPTTSYPSGEPLRAVTVVGEVSGDGPEPSDVIAGGFSRAAKLREIQPLPLEQVRDHLPVARLRFGFVELDAADAEAILALASPIPH